MTRRMRGRMISPGVAEAEALVTKEPVSFFGGVDPKTGLVIERGHELEGTCVSGKVFVFPKGKGSTVGSWVLYRLAEQGVAPKAIINVETEPIIAVGAIIGNIPLVDKLDRNPLKVIKTGDLVRVDANKATVEVLKAAKAR